jgi:hypothetical protein
VYRFPVWASLAQDYLSIMASSVSSEHAFSQGGITISKCQNRLKGDIVEALQFLKCCVRQDLIFHEPAPSSSLEVELEGDADGVNESSDGESDLEDRWDGLLIEDHDVDLEYIDSVQ